MDGTSTEEENMVEDIELAKEFDDLPDWDEEFGHFLKKSVKKNKAVYNSIDELDEFFAKEGTLDFKSLVKDKMLFAKRRRDQHLVPLNTFRFKDNNKFAAIY